MHFEIYESVIADEVKRLFTDVFTDSEGQEEGDMTGHLAFQLLSTTDINDIFTFVAKDNDNIIGCIIFTRMQFEQPINAFILSPVAIATTYQHQGLGQKLIQFGIQHLRQHHIELILTYGDPNFYAKLGFQPITEAIVKAPFTLSQPHGWLAQSLISEQITPIRGHSSCVSALNNPQYW